MSSQSIKKKCETIKFPSGNQNPTNNNYYEAVIFDMDGVIIDSLALDLEVVNKILKERFNKEISLEKIKEFFAFEIKLFFKKILEEVDADCSEDVFKEIVENYEALRVSTKFQVLPGVKALLESLKREKVPVAVASNNDKKDICRILRNVGLFDYFKAVIGNDCIARKKPKPDIFIYAAGVLGVDIKSSLVIEDSIIGVEAAKSAGAKTCAVSTGGTSFDDLRKARADFVLKSLEEVRDLVVFVANRN